MDFEEVVDEFRPKIFRFALASLRDRDVAETVAQDCLMRAYAAWDSFRGECSMQAWLMRIAINLIRRHARNRRWKFWHGISKASAPELLSACVSPDKSPETAAREIQQLEAIWSAAQSLPERQRAVFFLRFVEDMDILEIAAALGLKEGTVKAHLFRALAAVRGKLKANS